MIATELAARRAQGESTYALSRAYGLDWHTVRDILAAMGAERGGRTVRPVIADVRRCGRCEILLAEAPVGDAGICGWCRREVQDVTASVGWLAGPCVADGHT